MRILDLNPKIETDDNPLSGFLNRTEASFKETLNEAKNALTEVTEGIGEKIHVVKETTTKVIGEIATTTVKTADIFITGGTVGDMLEEKTGTPKIIMEKVGVNLPEYDYLSLEEQKIVTSEVHSYFKDIKSLINTSLGISAQQVFDVVYKRMPSVFVNAFVDFYLRKDIIQKFKDGGGGNNPNNTITVEMILKEFMAYSADAENVGIVAGIDIPQALKVWNKIVEKLKDNIDTLNKWVSVEEDTLDDLIVDIIPVKPIILAGIWAIMIVLLTDYYCKTNLSDGELKEVAKLVLSIVMSLFVGFTGYMHKGGSIAGVTSPTEYFKIAYEGYEKVKNIGFVPQKLKFPALDEFSKLRNDLKVSSGQGLNMMYTFRVGDTMLINLEGGKVITKDTAYSILKSLWPLPLVDQVNKMYKLYTEDRIYNL